MVYDRLVRAPRPTRQGRRGLAPLLRESARLHEPLAPRRGRQSACRTGRPAGLRAYPGRHVAGEDWQGADVHFPERRAGERRSPRWTRCARNSRPRAFRSRRVGGATGFWWSMIPTAINSSSTIRARLHPARLPEMKRNRPASLAGRRDNGGGVALQFRERFAKVGALSPETLNERRFVTGC